MTNNLELWNKVKRPPEDALKQFKRGGGFAGTAIKPMWSIHAMTETYGPCGIGWGFNEPQFQVQNANNEILVFCTVSVWHKSRENVVFGVGGDKLLVSQSNGLRTDDEAFKKAFTDAITNALKHLGVGADIHMGLWDGSKYADESSETKPTDLGAIHKPSRNPVTREEYTKLAKDIEDFKSITAAQKWRNDNASTLDALPTNWKDELWVTYQDRIAELKKGLAA